MSLSEEELSELSPLELTPADVLRSELVPVEALRGVHVILTPKGFSATEVAEAIKLCRLAGVLWDGDEYAVIPANVEYIRVSSTRDQYGARTTE